MLAIINPGSKKTVFYHLDLNMDGPEMVSQIYLWCWLLIKFGGRSKAIRIDTQNERKKLNV